MFLAGASVLRASNSCFLGCHVYCSPGVMGVMTTTTGGTAVLERFFYTSVLVSDQDRALDFYTNVLGLEKRVENPTPDGPRFLTVGVTGDDFQLVLWPGTPGQSEPAMGRPLASITIETDDCRKTFEELKARGVEFVSDVLEFQGIYVAQFQDPDGNRLQIREGRWPAVVLWSGWVLGGGLAGARDC
jgi:predicted enzyme related to lactoylglutathione lyase